MSPQAPQPYTPFQGGAAQTLESTHTPASALMNSTKKPLCRPVWTANTLWTQIMRHLS